MKNCQVCKREVEDHLLKKKQSLCFLCLTDELTETGVISTYGIKEKPLRAPCAICDTDSFGPDLFPSKWGFLCKSCSVISAEKTGYSWEGLEAQSSREWLIRANRRVLGPFTGQQVEDALRENRMVPVDEVSRAGNRWHFLRDESAFRLVLNEIKNRTSGDGSADQTATGLIGRGMEPTSPGLPGIPDVDLVMPGSNTSEPGRDLKTFVTVDSQNAPTSENKGQQRQVVVGLAVVLVLVTVLVTQITKVSNLELKEKKAEGFSKITERALMAEKVGNYVAALSLFKEALAVEPNNAEILLHLAPLTLLKERQTIPAEEMFDKILGLEGGNNYQKSAMLGKGLIALERQEHENAKKFFLQARNLDRDFVPAIANLGIVAFFQNEFDKAETLLLEALDKQKGRVDGAILVSLVDATLANGSGDQTKSKLDKLHKRLDEYLKANRDYFAEILIQDAKVLLAQKDKKSAEERLEQFLDLDPDQWMAFTRDWMIYRGRSSWGLLAETLKDPDLGRGPKVVAALGLARYRGREKLEGMQSIEDALARAPQEVLVQALAGWMELKLGKEESGAVKIKAASSHQSRYKLPHIMRARLCFEEQDFLCAKDHWHLVKDKDQKALEAFQGLAQAELALNRPDDSKRWIYEGLQIAPNYIPLLELEQQVKTKSEGGAK